MRKLKLQMYISINGIVGGSKEDTGFLWDADIRKFSIDNLKDVDVILLGSHTAPELITSWAKTAKNSSDKDQELGKRITEIPKIVFSHKITLSSLANTTIAKGPLKKEIVRLKKMPGKDMLTYGGAGFVSSLVKENLIDEYNLLVNPVAISKGLGIFQDLEHNLHLKLLETHPFPCGIVLMKYYIISK